jgi:hypothetical protein
MDFARISYIFGKVYQTLDGDRLFNRIKHLYADKRVILEYMRFLTLHANHLISKKVQANYSPSPLVDMVWHQHVLDTRRYSSDCVAICGEIIHHDPDGQLDDKQTKMNRLKTFLDDYETAFCVTPDTTIWKGEDNINMNESDTDEEENKGSDTEEEDTEMIESDTEEDENENRESYNVQRLVGPVVNINCFPNITLGMFKTLLVLRFDIPLDQHKLVYKGIELTDNDKMMKDHGFDKSVPIRMILRLGGC